MGLLPTENNIAPKVDLNKSVGYNLNDYKNYLGSEAYSKIGINPNVSPEELENKYDKAQPLTEALSSSFSKTLDNASNAFTGYIHSMNPLSDTKDLFNEQEDMLKQQGEEQMKNPSFQGNDTHGILATMFSGDFWEQTMPSLGFMAGTVVPAAAENFLIDATGGLFDGLGEIAAARGIYKIGKAADFLMGIGKIKKAKNLLMGAETGLTGMQQAVSYGKAAAQLYNEYTTSRSEAAMEGGQTLYSTKQNLSDEFQKKNGYKPFGEDAKKIDAVANDAAMLDYRMNFPILMASNILLFHDLLIPEVTKIAKGENALWDGFKIFKSSLGSEEEAVKESFKDMWKSSSTFGRIKGIANYVGEHPLIRFAKDAYTEGQEEALQRFSSTFSQDYYTNKYHDKESITDSLYTAGSDMLSDSGMKEFLGGFVIGALADMRHPITEVYKKATGKETESDLKRKEIQDNIQIMRENPLSMIFKQGNVKDALTSAELSRKMKSSIESGDLFNLKNNANLGILNYIWAGYKSNSLSYRLNELKKVADLDPNSEELSQMLGGINPADIDPEALKSIFGSLSTKIQDIVPMFKSVENYYSKHTGIQTARENAMASQKELDSYIASLAVKHKLEDTQNIETKIEPEEQDKLNDLINKRNELSAPVFAYEDVLKSAAFSMAGVQLDKSRQQKLYNELNSNNLGLSYYELPSLTNPSLTKKLISSKKAELKAAQDSHSKVGNLQTQIDTLEKLLTTKHPNEIADHIQNYTLLNAKNNEGFNTLNFTVNSDKVNYESDHFKKILDFVKLEKKNEANLNVHNWLLNVSNIEKQKEHYTKQMGKFLDDVLKWYQEQKNNKEEPKKDEPVKTPETSTDETQGAEDHIKEVISKYNGMKYTNIKPVFENGQWKIVGKELLQPQLEEKEIKDVETFNTALDNINKDYLDQKQKAEELKKTDEENKQWLEESFKKELSKYLDTKEFLIPSDRAFLNKLLDERENTPSIIAERTTLKNIASAPTEITVDDGIPETELNKLKEDANALETGAKPKTYLKTTTQEVSNPKDDNEQIKKNSYFQRIMAFKNHPDTEDGLYSGKYKLQITNGSLELSVELDLLEDGTEPEDSFRNQLTNDPSIAHKAIAPILMVVDENGKPILFNERGEQSTTGKPVWFNIASQTTLKNFNIQVAVKQLMRLGDSEVVAIEKLAIEKQNLINILKEFQDKNGKYIEHTPISVEFSALSKGSLLKQDQDTLTPTSSISDGTIEVMKAPKIEGQDSPKFTMKGNQVVVNGAAYLIANGTYYQLIRNTLATAKIGSKPLIQHIDELVEAYNNNPNPEDKDKLVSYLKALIYTTTDGIKISINSQNKIEFVRGNNDYRLNKNHPTLNSLINDKDNPFISAKNQYF